MSASHIYEACPVYETFSFLLRLVRPEDAPSLLACYSDQKAVSKRNTDHCTSNFYFTAVKEMEDCIRFWLKEYQQHKYVRFAVVSKILGTAVGTVEISGGASGILRIDLAAEYEKDAYVEEILRLAVFHFIRDFQIGSLKIKASNTPERIPLLKRYGFIPSTAFRPRSGYFERPVINSFDAEKGIGFCGLACCVCSENENCAGCRQDGCPDRANCKQYRCCKSNGLEGCWACPDFPCDSPMFLKLRVKTFSDYIAKNGTHRLIHALKENEERGLLYHHRGQLTGDYDLFQSEEEIMQLIDLNL